MYEFAEKVDKSYMNITGDKSISGNRHAAPYIITLCVLEAKGIITREEMEELKKYMIIGKLGK